MGVLVGLLFAAMFTIVPGILLSVLIIYGLPNVVHITLTTHDASTIAFTIAAISGISMGISVALGIAAPKYSPFPLYAPYPGQGSSSMSEPNNPYGWTNMNSPNNPNGWSNPNSPNNPNNPNNPGSPFHHRH